MAVPKVINNLNSLDKYPQHNKNVAARTMLLDETKFDDILRLGINGRAKLTLNLGAVGKQVGLVNGATGTVRGIF